MNGWVYVAERPFISRDLPVGVHVPFARHQDQLFFGKHRIHLRNRNAMECEIPSRVPRVLPLVGHRNNVRVVQVFPFPVATAASGFRRSRLIRVAFEPL